MTGDLRPTANRLPPEFDPVPPDMFWTETYDFQGKWRDLPVEKNKALSGEKPYADTVTSSNTKNGTNSNYF